MHHIVLVLALLCGGVVTACGPPAPRIASAVGSLPEYEADGAALFGDVLGDAVFGVPASGPPHRDARLRDRARFADFVAPVWISTVTEERLGGAGEYVLSLAPAGAALKGEAPASTFDVRVLHDSPTRSRIDVAGRRFVGRRVLLFARWFADRGAPTLHWYGEIDALPVRAVVLEVKSLDEHADSAQTAR
jgi:hypothetical protein